jgi:hypothetical protein
MRIESNRPIRATSARRDDRSKVGSGSFADALGDTEPSAPASTAAAPGALASLLALQEMPDATARRRKAVARGDLLLDRLDELRLGLLSGSMPRERLADLARAVRGAREEVDDPRLAEILGDIELRAAVELAKLAEAV